MSINLSKTIKLMLIFLYLLIVFVLKIKIENSQPLVKIH